MIPRDPVGPQQFPLPIIEEGLLDQMDELVLSRPVCPPRPHNCTCRTWPPKPFLNFDTNTVCSSDNQCSRVKIWLGKSSTSYFTWVSMKTARIRIGSMWKQELLFSAQWKEMRAWQCGLGARLMERAKHLWPDWEESRRPLAAPQLPPTHPYRPHTTTNPTYKSPIGPTTICLCAI